MTSKNSLIAVSNVVHRFLVGSNLSPNSHCPFQIGCQSFANNCLIYEYVAIDLSPSAVMNVTSLNASLCNR